MPFDLIVRDVWERAAVSLAIPMGSNSHALHLFFSQTGKFVAEKSNIWRDCVDGHYDWVKQDIVEVRSRMEQQGYAFRSGVAWSLHVTHSIPLRRWVSLSTTLITVATILCCWLPEMVRGLDLCYQARCRRPQRSRTVAGTGWKRVWWGKFGK